MTIRTRLAIALKEKSAERIAKHVPLTFKEEFSMTDGKAVMVDLCETCYMTLYHTQSKRTFQAWKADEKMKRFQNSVLSGAIGMGTMKSKRKRNYMGAQYANVLDADKACAGKGLDDTELRALCVPDNDASRQAFRWMTKFFKKYCEKPPNLTTTQQLPSLYTKGSIYKMMVQQLESEESTDEHAVISQEAFLDLWLATYPNVRITKFISVCGKCEPCAWLHEREELFKGEDELMRGWSFAGKLLTLLRKAIRPRPLKRVSIVVGAADVDEDELECALTTSLSVSEVRSTGMQAEAPSSSESGSSPSSSRHQAFGICRSSLCISLFSLSRSCTYMK